jgi:hypothetical protein
MTTENINPTTKRFARTTEQPVFEHYKRPVNYYFVVATVLTVGTIAGLILIKVI